MMIAATATEAAAANGTARAGRKRFCRRDFFLDHVGELETEIDMAEDGRDDHDSHGRSRTELAKEIQNVRPENRRFQFFRPTHSHGTDATPAGSEAQVRCSRMNRNNNYREQTR